MTAAAGRSGRLTVVRSLVISDADERGAVAAAPAVLPTADRERIARIRVRRHRIGVAAAHALLRVTLSWWDGATAPHAWRFERSPRGQLLLACNHGPSFSLTHTEGIVAVAVSTASACGVDAESVGRSRDVLALAPTVCTPEELRRLARLPRSQAADEMLELWTLKEAFSKARGLGLALGFARYGFERGERIVPSGPDVDPACWLLESSVRSGHRMAVAVQTSATGAHVIHWERTTWRDLLPLLGGEALP